MVEKWWWKGGRKIEGGSCHGEVVVEGNGGCRGGVVIAMVAVEAR